MDVTDLRITFDYTNRPRKGCGSLSIYQAGVIIFTYACRSGSCDKTGTLVNNIQLGRWCMIDPPVATKEKGMRLDPCGWGWKIRLYDSWKGFTHLLIHPDEPPNGTLGCIGIQKTPAWEMYYYLLGYWAHHKKVCAPVEVS